MKYLKRFWALLTGYYYVPCPVCGREMYGFEFDSRINGIMYTTARLHNARIGKITCSKACSRDPFKVQQ